MIIKQYAFRGARKLFYLAARSSVGTITHVVTRDPVVALTFDDGPHPEFTPRIVDLLGDFKARATFFMLGETAERAPQLVKYVAARGHAIGNHSWDHPSLLSLSRQARLDQIQRCAEVLAPYGSRIFRPPYGHQSIASHLDAVSLKHQVVTWSLSAEDWQNHNGQWIAERLLREIAPGSIVLFHDRLFKALDEQYFDRRPTLKALRLLLTKLTGRYKFVTIPELLKCGRPQRQNWYRGSDGPWIESLKSELPPRR